MLSVNLQAGAIPMDSPLAPRSTVKWVDDGVAELVESPERLRELLDTLGEDVREVWGVALRVYANQVDPQHAWPPLPHEGSDTIARLRAERDSFERQADAARAELSSVINEMEQNLKNVREDWERDREALRAMSLELEQYKALECELQPESKKLAAIKAAAEAYGALLVPGFPERTRVRDAENMDQLEQYSFQESTSRLLQHIIRLASQ